MTWLQNRGYSRLRQVGRGPFTCSRRAVWAGRGGRGGRGGLRRSRAERNLLFAGGVIGGSGTGESHPLIGAATCSAHRARRALPAAHRAMAWPRWNRPAASRCLEASSRPMKAGPPIHGDCLDAAGAAFGQLSGQLQRRLPHALHRPAHHAIGRVLRDRGQTPRSPHRAALLE